jgi:hypothetical protein
MHNSYWYRLRQAPDSAATGRDRVDREHANFAFRIKYSKRLFGRNVAGTRAETGR